MATFIAKRQKYVAGGSYYCHPGRIDLSKPYEGLFPTVDSAVLTVLSRSERPTSGREIARRAGRSHTGAQRVLDRLVEQGLVLQQSGGGALLYTLNRSHLAADSVRQLANLRTVLIDTLRSAIQGWRLEPVHASLFGSAARGDGGPDSDVDIFIVRPRHLPETDGDWMNQVDALNGAVPRWTGNRSGLIEVGQQDVDRLRVERPKIVNELLASAVHLAGRAAADLFGGDS